LKNIKEKGGLRFFTIILMRANLRITSCIGGVGRK